MDSETTIFIQIACRDWDCVGDLGVCSISEFIGFGWRILGRKCDHLRRPINPKRHSEQHYQGGQKRLRLRPRSCGAAEVNVLTVEYPHNERGEMATCES